ncbi:MAG TPA: electron transfer flavoprotein subunit beta/FixA family protein [Beutenbergiaceae bacterium]|nr:electron transfer flavoprotein subunit beta/FixA family protein [Beutenbergiaceae bacterium]
MRIVVCVKHVPELESDRAFDTSGRTVRTVENSTLNEVDENAVEEALQLRGEGEVIALTLGPAPAADALRRAMAMGADQGVHLCDEAFAGSDYGGTARALAAAINRLHAQAPVDLVLAGMTALDGLGSVVPTMLAAELDRPYLGVVHRLQVEGREVRAVREVDAVTEHVSTSLPAVVSVTDVINVPRFPKYNDIMAARGKELTVWNAAELGLATDDVGAAGARTATAGTQPRPPRAEPVVITDDDGDAGAQLAQYLIERDFAETR